MCDYLFKFIPFFFFFFNKVGLQDAMKDVYISHFVLMYLWFLKFAPGTAELQLCFLAAFLICFSIVENIRLIVLSRTSYFKIDVSYM